MDVKPNGRILRIFLIMSFVFTAFTYMVGKFGLEDARRLSFYFQFNIKDKLTSTEHNTTAVPDKDINDKYRPIRRGSYIRVDDLDVAIVTAVLYKHSPSKNGFNVFLNGWARHKAKMKFKCCFLNNLTSEVDDLVETSASVYHVYSQWVVDMQNGEFICTLTQKQLSLQPDTNRDFNYVAFAENSCKNYSTDVVTIERPQRVPKSVAICLKVSYGSLNPELIMEWFEYNKLLGVTKVYSFLSEDLEPDARKVFLYYNSTGFLEADPIHPAPSKNGSHRGFKHPRWDQQAFVDEVMAINDCKHRMSGFDFILVMDIDEWIIPTSPVDNIYTILKKTLRRYPRAGSFSFNSHVVMLDWGESRESQLHVMSYVNRTAIVNYDGADRNTRWAFIPSRTFYAQNNKAWPRKGFKVVDVPQKFYTLVHRRLCKTLVWVNCTSTAIRVRDEAIVRYENQMLTNIQKLPLHSILTNSTNYINAILEWTSPTVDDKTPKQQSPKVTKKKLSPG